MLFGESVTSPRADAATASADAATANPAAADDHRKNTLHASIKRESSMAIAPWDAAASLQSETAAPDFQLILRYL
jgi:hypothetical protein